MEFAPTRLKDAVLITLERRGDERGYFARTFCAETFRAAGLVAEFVQANHSASARRGTLRGLHFQRAPHREVKVVRCVKGAIRDVILDLRRDSPTCGHWQGFDLTEENGAMLYVPAGFAHGFQTLADDSHVTYQVSHPYTPAAEGGVRWDDPAFGIDWPLAPTVISPKDAAWPHAGAAGVEI
jgi:dTDP-4-dehydrorhamnose 3,5-epimerase